MICVRKMLVKRAATTIISFFPIDTGLVVVHTQTEILSFANVLYVATRATQSIHYEFTVTVSVNRKLEREFFRVERRLNIGLTW